MKLGTKCSGAFETAASEARGEEEVFAVYNSANSKVSNAFQSSLDSLPFHLLFISGASLWVFMLPTRMNL